MSKIKAYAAQSASSLMSLFEIERRAVRPKDVQIDSLFCGMCHSDLHTVRNEWGGGTIYPCIPGHEVVGRVSAIGNAVTKFKIGDHVGVGCMVDSCRKCPSCAEGLEQYCTHGAIWTYNSPDKVTGDNTHGGYSKQIVVDEDFVLNIPKNLDLAGAAPLLCAGVTTYSPLKHWGVGAGKKVGIVGLGGLGHMGVKIAHAMGAHTVMITSSEHKMADAKTLGADEVILSKDEGDMKNHENSFDFILNTIAAPHDLENYTRLLRRDSTMCLVGIPAKPYAPSVFTSLIMKRRSIAGSTIGGIAETQEMLNFCGAHNIVSEIETIPADKINIAFDRMIKSDVKYRFVIDLATME